MKSRFNRKRFGAIVHFVGASLVVGGCVFASIARAQTIINSAFTGANGANYDDPNNWSPAEVPNNVPGKSYNVAVRGLSLSLNVNAVVSILSMPNATFDVTAHSLSVAGGSSTPGMSFTVEATGVPVVVNFGALEQFSGTGLNGIDWNLNVNGGSSSALATVQFNGANVVKFSGSLDLGPNTRIVDEQGNDGLRNFAVSGSRFRLRSRALVVAGNFTNGGETDVEVDPNFPATASFTIKGSLTNFDATTHTLVDGKYLIDGRDAPATLQFQGADIVNNSTQIALRGLHSKIVDENGNDALRNFANNTSGGSLVVNSRDFTVFGNLTNDGVISLLPYDRSVTFAVKGSLNNFDPTTRTIQGGSYNLGQNGSVATTFQFAGADIVHNAASFYLTSAANVIDENGKNGLRNLAANQAAGRIQLLGANLTPPGDFFNAGSLRIFDAPEPYPSTINVPSRITLTPGHNYIQTAGITYMTLSSIVASNVLIDGGILIGSGTVDGSLKIGSAVLSCHDIAPTNIVTVTHVSALLAVKGNVVLSSDSHFRVEMIGKNKGVDYDFISVNGTAQLGGMLDVQLSFPANGQFTPDNADTFTVLSAGAGITGTFKNVGGDGRLLTGDGVGSFAISFSGNSVTLSDFRISPPPPSQLLNISTRMRVLTGEQVLIAGFIITGSDPKDVIIRGIGPSLSQFFAGVLADPTLDLFQGNTLLESNDNWKVRSDGSSQQATVAATGIPPSNDLESAIVRTLQPGAYTAILRGKGDTTGIGVVEAYDLNQTANSKFGNIATRGFVDTNDNVMIGGLIVGPANTASTKVVVSAIGPSLTNFGIAGALQDPTLELHDSSGTTLAANDNWKTRPDGSSQEAEVAATGLQPSDDRESALVQTLPPGNYTAVVRGKNNTTGIALVEVYNLQ
jgi:hypothetical protein